MTATKKSPKKDSPIEDSPIENGSIEENEITECETKTDTSFKLNKWRTAFYVVLVSEFLIVNKTHIKIMQFCNYSTGFFSCA